MVIYEREILKKLKGENMKNIKNNTSISDFDDFLCKLEEKEEFGCFIIRCWTVFDERCKSVFCISNTNCNVVTSDHDIAEEQNNDEQELTTEDEQDDEDELDTEDEQDDEDELDTEDDQDDEDEPEGRRESGCWIVWCSGNGDNKCGHYTPKKEA
ncbi:hypothetical protein AGMMS50233_09110 [Endomicrobiia bacterium]|nr:hypothetical protein AGMMS50233_09110 [Endomicrobiia bacterium]